MKRMESDASRPPIWVGHYIPLQIFFFFIQGKLKLGKEMQVGARQWETTPSDVINVLPSYLKGDEGLRKILLIKNGFILKLHINIFVPEPEQNVREFWQKPHETGLIFFHKNTNSVNRNPYLTTAKINSLKLQMCMLNKTRILSLFVQKDPWNSVAMIGILFCLWGQCSIPHPLVYPAGMWTNAGQDFIICLRLRDAKMEMRLVVHRRVQTQSLPLFLMEKPILAVTRSSTSLRCSMSRVLFASLLRPGFPLSLLWQHFFSADTCCDFLPR